jgi:tetratricopeptide (TPR) repeat protein
MRRHLLLCQLLLVCARAATAQAQDIPLTVRRAEPPAANATADELERAGDRWQSEESHLDALDYYQAALAKKPNNARLYNKLGIVELQMQRYNEARRHFEKTIKLERTFASAYNNLGSVYYGQRKYGAAIKQYRKAIQLEPAVASFHANMGAAYFAKKEFEAAGNSYARALELDPDVLERHARSGISAMAPHSVDLGRYAFVMAKLYARTGAIDRSLEHLQRAIAEGYKGLDKVLQDSDFAGVRKDPRFEEMMAAQPLAFQEQPH